MKNMIKWKIFGIVVQSIKGEADYFAVRCGSLDLASYRGTIS
jgi:hypothetical protein